MIYCVEDDTSILDLLTYSLKQTGYEVKGFSSAVSFIKETQKNKPNLVLLDLMLPDGNGFDILKNLKSNPSTSNIPVIILTAKNNEFEKVTGLDLGADDYMTKPFSIIELIARIKAVLRRYENVNGETLQYKNLVLYTKKHIVIANENKIQLTLKEYELLKKLMQNTGIVLTREQLLEDIWGYEYYGETRTVDVHIRTLRAKLTPECDYITTIRGVGYKIGE